ncbi:uncharacterized protein METZ01_LOCUS261305, partial [marine metagenome]
MDFAFLETIQKQKNIQIPQIIIVVPKEDL